MTPEKLMDAMNLLPDDLLEETNALRQKKHVPWRSLTALAACLCMVAGLWFVFPGAKTADSAAGSVKEDGTNIEDNYQYSQESAAAEYMVATVVKVCEKYITVVPGRQEELCDCVPQKVSFEQLEEIPELMPGQYVRLYMTEEAYLGELEIITTLTPYKIEIEEE